MTRAEYIAIRAIVREELRALVVELFGDPADPADGPLDVAALTRLRHTAEAVNDHTSREVRR